MGVTRYTFASLDLVSPDNIHSRMSAVTVRVPASISNLGPGFDCLGMALRLYNRITVERTSRPQSMPEVLDAAANVFFKQARLRPFSFSCRVRESLPRARGLGSSATVRLGLMCGLNRLASDPVSRDVLFQLCAELEGHPDNAAPACYGGFTVARPALVQRFKVSPRLKCVVLIPDHEIKTSAARKILPNRIDRTSAVRSCGDACAITAAFVSRDYGAMRRNFADAFHQPFRAKLIPYLNPVIAAAEGAGALGAFLSGSGSSIAALTLENPVAIGRRMAGAIGKVPARTVILTADNHGATLTQHKA
jgi:homoserine kinase